MSFSALKCQNFVTNCIFASTALHCCVCFALRMWKSLLCFVSGQAWMMMNLMRHMRWDLVQVHLGCCLFLVLVPSLPAFFNTTCVRCSQQQWLTTMMRLSWWRDVFWIVTQANFELWAHPLLFYVTVGIDFRDDMTHCQMLSYNER